MRVTHEAQVAMTGSVHDVTRAAHPRRYQGVVQNQTLTWRNHFVLIAVKEDERRSVGFDVCQGVCSSRGNAGIQRVPAGRFPDVLHQSLIAVDRVLGGTVKIGGDLGDIGRAKIVDDALHLAALFEIAARFKRTVSIREADHRGEVAAGGLAPDNDSLGIDSLLISVCAQVPDRCLDVFDAISIVGPVPRRPILHTGNGKPGFGHIGA